MVFDSFIIAINTARWSTNEN